MLAIALLGFASTVFAAAPAQPQEPKLARAPQARRPLRDSDRLEDLLERLQARDRRIDYLEVHYRRETQLFPDSQPSVVRGGWARDRGALSAWDTSLAPDVPWIWAIFNGIQTVQMAGVGPASPEGWPGGKWSDGRLLPMGSERAFRVVGSGPGGAFGLSVPAGVWSHSLGRAPSKELIGRQRVAGRDCLMVLWDQRAPSTHVRHPVVTWFSDDDSLLAMRSCQYQARAAKHGPRERFAQAFYRDYLPSELHGAWVPATITEVQATTELGEGLQIGSRGVREQPYRGHGLRVEFVLEGSSMRRTLQEGGAFRPSFADDQVLLGPHGERYGRMAGGGQRSAGSPISSWAFDCGVERYGALFSEDLEWSLQTREWSQVCSARAALLFWLACSGVADEPWSAGAALCSESSPAGLQRIVEAAGAEGLAVRSGVASKMRAPKTLERALVELKSNAGLEYAFVFLGAEGELEILRPGHGVEAMLAEDFQARWTGAWARLD